MSAAEGGIRAATESGIHGAAEGGIHGATEGGIHGAAEGGIHGATFSWSVATPEGTVASGECEFLVVPTAGGELGVMAEHAALAASVVPGELRVTKSGTVTTVSVGAGVVDVRDNRVRVLVSASPQADSASPQADSASPQADSASPQADFSAGKSPG
jgi:F0F1-type ATP synthase epsilon subunit